MQLKAFFFGWATLASVVIGPAANGGVVIGERVGANFNNLYADSDTKSDWQGLSMDVGDASVSQTIADLGMTVDGGYRNFRIGFSRSMAQDPRDLGEWLDTVQEVIQGGNKVLVAGWFENDISDPVGDAALWRTVVDAIDARGLIDGVSGWELQNEPEGSGQQWRDYVRSAWKKAGPHGDVGWANLTQQQRDETAAAWRNKPIVIQGTTYGQHFDSALVNGLDGLNDLVWSVHDYAKFSGIIPERENWTVEQWRDQFLGKWESNQSLLNGNYIVTELGNNASFDPTLTGMGPSGTTTDDRRDAGFIRAAEQRYGSGDDTTVFWYTAYNPAPIGIGFNYRTAWRKSNIQATNFVFSSGADSPTGPEGTTNVALGKPVLVDSTNGGYSGSNAVDGEKFDVASRWLSANTSADHWIEIDLQDDYLISELRFWMGYNNFENAISDFRFEHYQDGEWQTIFTESGNNNPVYAAGFDPVRANRVRLYSTEGLDDTVRLFEIEVFGVLAPEILAGDYNADGRVDAADYTVWRDHLGAPAGSLPNDADGGEIGIAQYLTWRLNFGANDRAPTAPGSTPVPEPKAALLLAAGAILWGHYLKSRVLGCGRSAA